MTRYIVTDKGPIDTRAPGTDVTGIYDDATAARLVDEGYLSAVEPEAAQKPAKRRKAAASDAGNGKDVTDGA